MGQAHGYWGYLKRPTEECGERMYVRYQSPRGLGRERATDRWQWRVKAETAVVLLRKLVSQRRRVDVAQGRKNIELEVLPKRRRHLKTIDRTSGLCRK